MSVLRPDPVLIPLNSGRLNRVRSVVTQKVNLFVSTEVSVHAALQVEVSGQLRFLGLIRCYLAYFVAVGYVFQS